MPQPSPWTPTVITLFPQLFPGTLGAGILKRAYDRRLWDLRVMDLKDFGQGSYNKVDDRPFGGGPGLVLKAEPLARALEHARMIAPQSPLYCLSPRGRPLKQAQVNTMSREAPPILLCGRYEGLDERVFETFPMEELSIGDFILPGGESACMVLLEALIRCRDGVVGDPQSLQQESFARYLLEYPHYTKPFVWRGKSVPEVLVSGHHEKIDDWRRKKAEDLTRHRRGDLWEAYVRAQRSS